MTVTTQALTLRRLDLAAVAAGDPDARRDHDALVRRGAVPDQRVRAIVRATLADVRARGDAAVRDANASVGGGRPDGRLVLDEADLLAARDALDARIRHALDQAIDHVRRFAETQRPVSTTTVIAPGIEIERRWSAIASVGAYVPGGSAAYPSSLVMTVVPAQVAGVDRIVVASPAGRDGVLDPVLLGAAGLLGVDAFIVAGGAQAVGALAYGLPEAGVEPVDRIVGPGNAWVTAAKIEVCGEVGIDLPAGPSEGMVLAAPPADPVRVAADLITQAEHGPDSPAILVTTDRAFADQVEAAVTTRLATAARRDILATALRDHGRIVLAPTLDAAVAFVNAYAPEHLSVDVEPLEPTVARLRNAGSIFVGPWAPGIGRRLRDRRQPRPADRRPGPRIGGARRRELRQVQPGPADRPVRLGFDPRDHRDPRRGRGPARPSRRRRDPLRGARPMSPTPVSFTSPAAPSSYSWEATDDEVAARYGLDPATIVRFDLNTSPTPPTLVAGLLAAGRFEAPLSEYPPTDYRRLVEAAAARYGVSPAEILVGAGADEILDIVAKVHIPAGGRAVVPTPTYAMYRVLTEQRGATVVAVPRLGAAEGYALDVPAMRAAVRDDDIAVVWLCSPNNPTALAEPDGAIAAFLAGLTEDAATTGRPAPVVVLDEAYAEFVGTSLVGLREAYPRSHHGPDRQQGLRPGRAPGRLRRRASRGHRPAQPVPAARVGVDRVRHARHRSAARPVGPRRQPRARGGGTGPPDSGPHRGRLVGRPVGDELHPGRLRRASNGRPRSPSDSCRTVSCRERSAPATRWPTIFD